MCPLIYWTEKTYGLIRDKDLPYNELHDQIIQVLVAFHVHHPHLILMIHVLVVGPIPSKTECGLHVADKP